jgi:hypothetical protein
MRSTYAAGFHRRGHGIRTIDEPRISLEECWEPNHFNASCNFFGARNGSKYPESCNSPQVPAGADGQAAGIDPPPVRPPWRLGRGVDPTEPKDRGVSAMRGYARLPCGSAICPNAEPPAFGSDVHSQVRNLPFAKHSRVARVCPDRNQGRPQAVDD